MSEQATQAVNYQLEDQSVLAKLKEQFAPDGAAEREHNARAETAGFGSIHYALITNLRPQRVLAIGSRHGYVPSILALALKTNGFGTIDFVDANYSDTQHGEQIAYGGVENWHGDASKKFSCFGLRDVMNVHIQRSSEFFSECDAGMVTSTSTATTRTKAVATILSRLSRLLHRAHSSCCMTWPSTNRVSA